jgi:hypothetical protein
MTPLPFDYSRCLPATVCDKCHNCRRWKDHPEQVNDPNRQSFVAASSSRDAACHHMPISLLENK